MSEFHQASPQGVVASGGRIRSVGESGLDRGFLAASHLWPFIGVLSATLPLTILLPIIVNPKVEMELLQHANDVRDSIQDGDLTFEEAAQKFSDSPERTRGGDLGWARLGTYQFDGEAFKQETGKM